jgi:hypothetical protein
MHILESGIAVQEVTSLIVLWMSRVEIMGWVWLQHHWDDNLNSFKVYLKETVVVVVDHHHHHMYCILYHTFL